MKAKLNFKSKRTIIIIAIIAVIAIAAAVAGYYFIKGNNTAGATNAGEQTSESSNSEALETPSTSAQSGNNGVDATNPEQNQEQGTDVANNDGNGEQTTGDVTETTENGEPGTTTENAGTTTGAQGGTTAGTGTGTGTTAQVGTTGTITDNTETDATTTYEQVEENIVVEEPWETHMVEWTPETFNVSTASVELSQRNLLVEKTATTSTGYSLVSAGEKITYTIKVTNNEETTLNSLYISDVIPIGTIFESVDERGTTITDGNNNVTRVVWNLWNLGLKQNESIEVSFVVKVAENAKGTITNIALAEGEESTSTNNSVLESSKTSIITRGEENKVVAEPARANDEITYTISVKNTGDVAGNTLIKDSDLVEKVLNDEKATLVGEIKVYEEKDGTETEKETITLDTLTKNGYEVNIAEKSTIKVVYTIKLNKISGKVLNKATIGDTDTNTDEVETIGIDVEKEVTDILRTENDKLDSVGKDAPAKVGDLIQYKIVVTNVGSTKLVDVKVEDKLEGVKIISGNLNIGELEAGASVELTAEYQVTSEKDIIGKIDRKIVNVVKVTGTEERKDPEKEPEKVTDTDEVETQVEEVKELVVEKTATKVNDGEVVPVKENDIITYEIKVTNTGNVTLNNIVVNESLEVVGSLEIGTLAPGEDKTIEVTYKVKAEDVNDKTTLENVVTATGKTTDEEEITSEEDKEIVDIKETKTNVTITKVWDDNGNTENRKDITINLYYKDENEAKVIASVPMSAEVDKTSNANEWKYTFKDLKAQDDNGNNIQYKAEEVNVPSGYVASYSTDGLTITNTYVTKKKTSVTDKEKVLIGENIEYVIKVKNYGTTPVKNYEVQDTDLLQLLKDGKVVMMNGENEVDKDNTCITVSGGRDSISAQQLADGYKITEIDGKEEVTIKIVVKLKKALPGDTIINTLVGEESNDTKVENEVTAKVDLLKTISNPQEAVVVIDLSLSMAQAAQVPKTQQELKDPMAYTYEDTRWYALTTALDSFIDSYMKDKDGKDNDNKITILGYNENIKSNGEYLLLRSADNATDAKNCYTNIFTKAQFTKLKNAVNNFNNSQINQWNQKYDTDIDTSKSVREIDVDGLKDTTIFRSSEMTKLGSGTNIEAGLLGAKYQLGNGDLTGKHVILMTDGEANRYVSNIISADNYEVVKSGSSNEIVSAANKIKNSGAKLYTIALSLSESGASILKEIASPTGSSSINNGKFFYSTDEMDKLEQYFKTISETITPGEQKDTKTVEGKLILDDNIKLDPTAVTSIVVKVNGKVVLNVTKWSDFEKYYSTEVKDGEEIRKINVRQIIDDYNTKASDEDKIDAITENVSITIIQE